MQADVPRPSLHHRLNGPLNQGVEKAGRFVVGVKPDGTLIVDEKPIDSASFVPAEAQTSPTAEMRRMGDYFNGGSSEAQGA
ncbi:hypothetical protein [Bradyrhizobium sp.]|uniref:hypothetical protein n=1 Tax=Bradyrhizobium sp. TaxID=376 RepID=UPI003BAEF93F